MDGGGFGGVGRGFGFDVFDECSFGGVGGKLWGAEWRGGGVFLCAPGGFWLGLRDSGSGFGKAGDGLFGSFDG